MWLFLKIVQLQTGGWGGGGARSLLIIRVHCRLCIIVFNQSMLYLLCASLEDDAPDGILDLSANDLDRTVGKKIFVYF